MRSFIAVLAVATGLVAALPKRQQAAVTFTDTYDALSTATDVGLLHGLEYTGATVRVHKLANGIQPVVPHSKPKFAEGIDRLMPARSDDVSSNVLLQINGAQNVSSWDLYSFWFACAAWDSDLYGPAIPCTIAVKGVSDDGRKYTSTFDYSPESSPDGSPFVKAQFYYPDFRQINNVTMGIVAGSAPQGNTAVAIDSLEHINYA